MSTIRILIEHLFGRILNLWGSDGHKYLRKIGSQPVVAYYMIAVLLMNIRTYIGDSNNQVSNYFDCRPPTLREYLGSVSRLDGDIMEEDIM
jgi:nuclease HARBI1